MTSSRQRVVIVGGSLGGVKAALDLCGDRHFDVTLLTEHPIVTLPPELLKHSEHGYFLHPGVPLTELFRGRRIRIVQGRATHLDRRTKTITAGGHHYPYDELIVALDSEPVHTTQPVVGELSYHLSTPTEVKRLAKAIHAQVVDPHKPALNFAIIGGGTHGIAIAGSLADYVYRIIDAHDLSYRRTHIDLLESQARIAPKLPRLTARLLHRRLRRMGVHVYTNSPVRAETDHLAAGQKPLLAHTIIWANGEQPHEFYRANHFTLTGGRNIATDDYLQAGPDIYIIGHNIATPHHRKPATAWQEGSYIARNLNRKARHLLMERYKAPVISDILPVGQSWSLIRHGKLNLHGRPARLGHRLAIRAAYPGHQTVLQPASKPRKKRTRVAETPTRPTCCHY